MGMRSVPEPTGEFHFEFPDYEPNGAYAIGLSLSRPG